MIALWTIFGIGTVIYLIALYKILTENHEGNNVYTELLSGFFSFVGIMFCSFWYAVFIIILLLVKIMCL